jgi:hypothetical protein
MKCRFALLVLVLSLGAFAAAADTSHPADEFDRTIDKITARETENMKGFAKYSPIVETYVQGFRKDKELGRVPVEDQYFLGRASFKSRLQDDPFIAQERPVATHQLLREIKEATFAHRRGWVPLGFTQMAMIDMQHFDRAHYKFVYHQREFLGTVRCLVFDVTPTGKGHGQFVGRIWVEDQGFNIVRFNGTYIHPAEGSEFLHFDSWRLNVSNGLWLPAYIYSEESGVMADKLPVALRGQTRLWGYATSQTDTGREFSNAYTAIQVDAKDAVSDQIDSSTPLASQKAWERQAENNYIFRLEQAGLVAPVSPLSEILETVVNNLIITNNLVIEPEVRCRVLLTAPMESFAIGHTIVVSRGLIDALPDEAALAAVLAHELSHIVLAHDSDNSQFAFSDRLIFPDTDALDRLRMVRSSDETKEADEESAVLLQNSPYKDKLQNMGLFLKQMEASRKVLPNLLRSRLSDSLVGEQPRLMFTATAAPDLTPKDIHQIAALPLGSRVIMDPWSGRVDMNRARSSPVVAIREKLPFTLTPFDPYLTRANAEREVAPAQAALPNSNAAPAQDISHEQASPTSAAQAALPVDSPDGAK